LKRITLVLLVLIIIIIIIINSFKSYKIVKFNLIHINYVWILLWFERIKNIKSLVNEESRKMRIHVNVEIYGIISI